MTVFHVVIVPPKAGLVGQKITFIKGGPQPRFAHALTGQAITSTQGTVSFSKSGLTLLGQRITSAQGTLGVSKGSTFALTGQAITSAQGTLFASKPLTGLRITSTKGGPQPRVALALQGRAFLVSKGFVSGMRVTNTSLPDAVTGTPYSVQINVTGGFQPYSVSEFVVPNTGGWLSCSSSGLLTGTPGTAESESVQITVQDTAPSTIQKSFTLTIKAGGLAADPFPRTRWQVIQPNAGVYAGATFQANAAKFNIVDFGPFPGIEQQGVNFNTVFANIKAASMANGFPTPTRCLHYVNSWVSAPVPGQSGGNTATYTRWETAVNSANWWLRTSWPGGTIVKSTFSGETVNTGVTAITSANNHTFQPTGAAGLLTIGQAFWFHYDGVLRLGNAVSQGYASNVAFVANPNLDGYQMDNIFAKTRVAGSYTMNTTSQAVGDNAASALNQQGEAAQVAALKAINPNLLVMGNCDYFVHSTSANNPVTTLDPSQVGIWDMVYCQAVIGPAPGGGAAGIDGFVSNTQAMGMLIAAEAQMAPSGTLIFEQTGRGPGAVSWTNASQASWVAADWQAARFGLSWCCMRNHHYALNATENYSPSSPYFMDEYSPQGGVYGWLGAPIDAPQSAARTSGVWWRKFHNGVVFWNPAGNGVQNLTLVSLGLAAGLKTIAHSSFGDASINTNAVVTTITLADRDGRFLIGAP